MQQLTNNLHLYHGSYCEVQIPDLKRCAKYKDFGQGFYLTTSKKQAENFAIISTRKAITNGIVDSEKQYGIVSVFQFSGVEKLSIKIYPTADADWLHCVVGHRKKESFNDVVQGLKDFDIIAGKIANDSTNAMITTYIAGAYGVIGSKSADDICISLLLPERLEDQICFRTEGALKCLTFVESEQIWL